MTDALLFILAVAALQCFATAYLTDSYNYFQIFVLKIAPIGVGTACLAGLLITVAGAA